MATVKLIQDDERLVLTRGESKFYYKRIKSQVAANLRRQNTRRGEVDFTAYGFAILDSHLLGWDRIEDANSKEVPFSQDAMRLLPDEILADLVIACSSAEGTFTNMEEALKKTKDVQTTKNS